jgi:hypothetical protein
MVKRVAMREGISGTRDGIPWPPVGGEIDLPDWEADTLVAAGIATPAPTATSTVSEHGPAEVAVRAHPDTPERPSRPRRRQ